MLLSGISMLVMMNLKELSLTGLGLAGILMGASFGFFWANRDFLALSTTNDSNRNYYYGLETFFIPSRQSCTGRYRSFPDTSAQCVWN
jgi:YQGE family putative transporter